MSALALAFDFTALTESDFPALTFHRLEGNEAKLVGSPPESVKEFPPDLVQTMEKYKPEGSSSLLESIKKIEADLNSLRTEVNRHDRFEEILTRDDTQIEKLLNGLSIEADSRKSGDDKLSKAVDSMSQTLGRFERIGRWLGLIATAILIAWLSKILGLI